MAAKTWLELTPLVVILRWFSNSQVMAASVSALVLPPFGMCTW